MTVYAFYKERGHVYMCGVLTSSILIDEVNNYTSVILRIAFFDLNCPFFTYLDFWLHNDLLHFQTNFINRKTSI